MFARALFRDPVKKIAIEEARLPPLAPSLVQVRTAFSYLSAGTELSLLQMSENPNMRGQVARARIGYSLSGVVEAVGEGVSHVKAGDRVACIGAGAYHAEVVQVGKNLVTPLPEDISLQEAAPSAMMCFALEGVRKAAIGFGENVLVLGAGMMGQIASQMLYRSGGNVFLMDANAERLKKAVDGVETLGADEGSWAQLREMTAPVGVEAAVFCLGGEQTELFQKVLGAMTVAPDGVPQGRAVFPGGATIRVSLASPSGNVQILSSAKAGPGYRDENYEGGADYPLGYVKWPVRRNVEVCLRAIARNQLDIASLITHTFPFEDALKGYEKLAARGTNALGVLLEYEV
ncbi:alcohol dehydrogenase [bacterium]|nr:alcohol dehydrogenase [bacterium]